MRTASPSRRRARAMHDDTPSPTVRPDLRAAPRHAQPGGVATPPGEGGVGWGGPLPSIARAERFPKRPLKPIALATSRGIRSGTSQVESGGAIGQDHAGRWFSLPPAPRVGHRGAERDSTKARERRFTHPSLIDSGLNGAPGEWMHEIGSASSVVGDDHVAELHSRSMSVLQHGRETLGVFSTRG